MARSHLINAPAEAAAEDFRCTPYPYKVKKVNRSFPALKAPGLASPGQRPGFRHRTAVCALKGRRVPHPFRADNRAQPYSPGRCPGLASSAPLARQHSLISRAFTSAKTRRCRNGPQYEDKGISEPCATAFAVCASGCAYFETLSKQLSIGYKYVN